MNGMVRSFLIVLLLASSSCSSLFYHPTRQLYYDPAWKKFQYETLPFQAEDGTQLYAWYFPKRKGPYRGTIVQFHGNAQNMSTHWASLIWVIDQGYNFMTFDYRGYGGSMGSPDQEGVHQDALAAIALAEKKSKPISGKKDIVLYGQSLGGAVLLRAFAEVPDRKRVRAVVIEGSFPNYKRMARRVLSRSWLTWLFQPLGYLVVSNEYSPEEFISQVSPTPLLVIHGTADEGVEYVNGQEIFELARDPKTFWEVSEGRHLDTMTRKEEGYREKFTTFLEGL